METVHTFKFGEIEVMLRKHVIEKTMNSMLESKEVRATVPYGDYKVTIRDMPEEIEDETVE